LSKCVLTVNLYSPDNRHDQVFISNDAYIQLQQQIARTPGVGNTQIFGQRQYAMRIWMDPARMTAPAFTVGVIPLPIATGAGAEVRQSIGTPWSATWCWQASSACYSCRRCSLDSKFWRNARWRCSGGPMRRNSKRGNQ
jgi:AcrB/AcrD/AcrF family